MNPDEYAAQWAADLAVAEASRDRTVQTHDRILGVSDIMHCRSYAARFLAGDPFTDSGHHSAAMAGTAIHAYVLPIMAGDGIGGWRKDEVEFTVTLSNGFQVLGHGDLLDWEEPSATDLKTVEGLAHVKRYGSTPAQKMQRHLTGAGMVQSTTYSPVKPADLIVRNVWMDRFDLLATPHVEQEPYDPTYLDTAATWVDEVMYHVDNDLVEQAPKDKDIFWCREFCPFATACRGEEKTAVDEVIQSDELAVAAALRREAIDMEREAKELRKASDQVLSRVQDAKVLVQGEAGTFRVASTWVNPTDIDSYTRAGYYKTDVKQMGDK